MGENNKNDVQKKDVNVETEGLDQLIEDQQLLGIYAETLDDLRNTGGQLDDVLNNFIDMVFNEGDATTSTKEAIVNLIKVKADMADKKTRIADLWTRIKLKERDTMPKWLAAQINEKKEQEDTKRLSRREMLKTLEKAKKQQKESADGNKD